MGELAHKRSNELVKVEVNNLVKLFDYMLSNDKNKDSWIIERCRQWTNTDLIKRLRISHIKPNTIAHKKMLEATFSILSSIVNWYKTSERMNASEIKILTYLIIDKYKTLSFEDLLKFQYTVMRGDYGKIYNRVDGQTIIEMLNIYEDRNVIDVRNNKNVSMHRELESPVSNKDEKTILDVGSIAEKFKIKSDLSKLKNEHTYKWYLDELLTAKSNFKDVLLQKEIERIEKDYSNIITRKKYLENRLSEIEENFKNFNT